MTEPTPVPDDAGGGAHTVAERSTSTRSTSTRSTPNPHSEAGTSTNGHHVNGRASQRGSAHLQSSLLDADPYLGGGGDQRSADEIEAGIVALWQAFGEHRDQELRDRLVLHYAPLVKYVAGRVGTGLPSHVEVSDLIQSGIFGLVDAIEKFEPERGLKFETYAMQRIRGAILDDLRAQDWVPRSVRSRARDVERALERLEAKLQRTATDAELAEEVGMSTEELRDLLAQLQMTSVVALDDLIGVGRGTASLAETLPDDRAEDPVAALVDRDSRRQLAEAVERLSDRDRIVVTLYYFENLTLAEIGKVLGVTESRVCQLHTRAVLRLRSKLTEHNQ
jgi:RNA polymerase sigma factor FliA